MIDSAGGFPRIKWEAPRHVSVPISTRFSPLLMRACPPVTKKALLSSQPLCNSSGCRTVWASVAMELIALFTKSVRTADLGSSLSLSRIFARRISLLLIISMRRHWHMSFPSTHFLNMPLIWSASKAWTETSDSQLMVADRFPPISSALSPKDSPSTIEPTSTSGLSPYFTPSSPFSKTYICVAGAFVSKMMSPFWKCLVLSATLILSPRSVC